MHASVADYHTSGAWNGLGVAALACRLRGADAGVLRHALGIAEYHGPRSQMMREIDNPTMLHDRSGMGVPRTTSEAQYGLAFAMAVLLVHGRILHSGDVHARGGPEAWMDDAEVEAKFYAMAGCLAPARRQAIWAMRDGLLDPEARFTDLMAHLFAASEAS
ncbi:hypothetical protein [Roseovarius carneus]|uniref:hypothetical protein n=1 Tax=Roseovarius carneus TaxID=2853164 RepID=UPI001CCC79C6|nr:hypothetical protein [Roseovarius carneus]